MFLPWYNRDTDREILASQVTGENIRILKELTKGRLTDIGALSFFDNGVRQYAEEGDYVITDGSGHYSTVRKDFFERFYHQNS